MTWGPMKQSKSRNQQSRKMAKSLSPSLKTCNKSTQGKMPKMTQPWCKTSCEKVWANRIWIIRSLKQKVRSPSLRFTLRNLRSPSVEGLLGGWAILNPAIVIKSWSSIQVKSNMQIKTPKCRVFKWIQSLNSHTAPTTMVAKRGRCSNSSTLSREIIPKPKVQWAQKAKTQMNQTTWAKSKKWSCESQN